MSVFRSLRASEEIQHGYAGGRKMTGVSGVAEEQFGRVVPYKRSRDRWKSASSRRAGQALPPCSRPVRPRSGPRESRLPRADRRTWSRWQAQNRRLCLAPCAGPRPSRRSRSCEGQRTRPTGRTYRMRRRTSHRHDRDTVQSSRPTVARPHSEYRARIRPGLCTGKEEKEVYVEASQHIAGLKLLVTDADVTDHAEPLSEALLVSLLLHRTSKGQYAWPESAYPKCKATDSWQEAKSHSSSP